MEAVIGSHTALILEDLCCQSRVANQAVLCYDERGSVPSKSLTFQAHIQLAPDVMYPA
jgi:hypothetical protein